MNPLLLTDGYKLSHREQYPEGTNFVYSNWTPRKSRINTDYAVHFGTQYVMMWIHEQFEQYFFSVDKDIVCAEYKSVVESYLGTEYDISHIEDLHDLGYLPLRVKALPEGTKSPIRTPMIVMYNTVDEFFWLTNYLETLLSTMLWQPMTSATIAHEYRLIFEKWADKTGCNVDIIPDVLSAVDIQGHDFSMRGMGGDHSAILSGMGHLTSFKGTDTLPAVNTATIYYGGEGIIGTSVPATEHSVMCAGTEDDEFETFKRLITEVYPSGIVSIVSDTWDLWKVLTDYLPRLKDEIIARDGKVVIRPDSGDPADIICGDILGSYREGLAGKNKTNWTPKEKGVVELLWDTFGGAVNEEGFKVLDPHIGCIYGDSITLDRAENICRRLHDKGFASTNWVAGIGSYTYQYNTRDTLGFAMKATYVEVDGIGREIFKDPITDDGTKKSAKGLIKVNPDLSFTDGVNFMDEGGELQTIFIDGKFENQQTVTEIRSRLKL